MKKRRLLLLILLAMTSISMGAQIFPYRLMSPIRTSPSEELHKMFFDRQGLMWIGTNSGLKSFDGYSMHTYKSDAYSPKILPNNTILSIAEDDHDHLWLGTRNGLVRMNRRTHEFRTFYLPTELQQSVYTLFTDKQGVLWIGTDGGLSYQDPKTGKFHTYDASNSILVTPAGKRIAMPISSVKAIVEDNQGNLFIGTWSTGLLRLKKGTHTFYQYPTLNTRNSAFSLFFDSRRRLWVGTWDYGAVRMDAPYNQRHPQIHHYPYQTGNFDTFYKIIEDPVAHQIIGCTREGIAMLDINTPDKSWETYRQVDGCSLSFTQDIVTDGQGSIWVLTRNQGIVPLSASKSPFTTFALDTSHYPFYINAVSALYTPDGTNFWIAINPYGLALYNRQTGQTVYNQAIPGFQHLTSQMLRAQISCIVQRKNGELWMASNSYGIIIRRTDGQAVSLRHSLAPYLNDNYVNALHEDRRGTMWIGQRSGVSIVLPNGQGYLLKSYEGTRKFYHCDVRNISEDNEGNIWWATENEGIVKVTGSAARGWIYHQYCPAQGNYAVEDATACMQDSKGRLWAISNSGGLFLYHREKDQFMPKNRAYHIDCNRIFAINEDVTGAIWLTTDDGLQRLTFNEDDNPDITNYKDDIGISHALFLPNAVFKHGKELFFGCRQGFIAYAPHQLQNKEQRKHYNLMITDMQFDGIAYQQYDSIGRHTFSALTPSFTREITVPAHIKKIAILFALLSYNNAQQNKYAYQLEGYDNKWQHCSAESHAAYYQNLPAGTYIFHLKAADSDGNWQDLPYTIRVRILPPWYASWWAFGIYVLLLATSLFSCIKWYKNHLKTKSRLQMAVILTNITHEILTPLTVISASVDQLRHKAPQYDEEYGMMQNNIQRLTRLLRQILEVRKAQAGQLRLLVSHGNLSQFVGNICHNMQPMADQLSCKLSIHVQETAIMGWFDTDKMDKILYNLLSNAFKYNKECGCVTVTLTATNDVATLCVADEGIGITPNMMKHLYSRFLDGDYRRMNAKGTGIGLSLTRDLVKLHHGQIDCQSEEGHGTTFTIILPIGKAAYQPNEIDEQLYPTALASVLHSENSSHDLSSYLQASTQRQASTHLQSSASSLSMSEDAYTILIVEDNNELLTLMRNMLGEKYQVITAHNGQQAMGIVKSKAIDIIISDVMMPVMDGMQLTQRVKQDPDYAQLPIILLTAKTRKEDRDEAYKTGADEYITKPFNMDELQLRIDNILINRQRIRERFTTQTNFKVEEQHYSSPDELFVQRSIDCVKNHLNDAEYNREAFARDMCVSSSTLYNKLRALTGQNITGFINSIRLKEACRIMDQHPDIQVTELSTMVGFNTPRYFSRCFKTEFGLLPSEYATRKDGVSRDSL